MKFLIRFEPEFDENAVPPAPVAQKQGQLEPRDGAEERHSRQQDPLGQKGVLKFVHRIADQRPNQAIQGHADRPRLDGGTAPVDAERERDFPRQQRGIQLVPMKRAAPDADRHDELVEVELERVPAVVRVRRDEALPDQRHQKGRALDGRERPEGRRGIVTEQAQRRGAELVLGVRRFDEELPLAGDVGRIRHGVGGAVPAVAAPVGDRFGEKARGDHQNLLGSNLRRQSAAPGGGVPLELPRTGPEVPEGTHSGDDVPGREEEGVPPPLAPDHGFVWVPFGRQRNLERQQWQQHVQQHARRLKPAALIVDGEGGARPTDQREPVEEVDERETAHHRVAVEAIVVRQEPCH